MMQTRTMHAAGRPKHACAYDVSTVFNQLHQSAITEPPQLHLALLLLLAAL